MENKLLYLMRVGACWYIKGKGIWKGHCMICGKKRKTTAHHLFPRRIHKHIENEDLREIRVLVCDDCHKKLHPENKVFTKDEALKILSLKNSHMSDGLLWRAMKINKLKGIFQSLKIHSKDVIRDAELILEMNDDEFKNYIKSQKKLKEANKKKIENENKI